LASSGYAAFDVEGCTRQDIIQGGSCSYKTQTITKWGAVVVFFAEFGHFYLVKPRIQWSAAPMLLDQDDLEPDLARGPASTGVGATRLDQRFNMMVSPLKFDESTILDFPASR
jgi:hypothetical protein